ncbi:hypothetical protein ACFQ3R_02705 [Mesonia ostreae]|uniref:Lipoprotein n=1 Tax=Mesonia ostreae TaxID=861110 RepID=A0ABU2KKY6_9FLAO|nr:hypothetical protein [Mesonia ostreae]MDT0295391.1 hypothetical protein [Mesonia ostreae]
MRKLVYLFMITIAVIACQDDKKSSSNESIEEMEEESGEVQIDKNEKEQDFEAKEEDKEMERDEDFVGDKSMSSNSENDRPGPSAQWTGEFVKTNALNTAGACSCNCLDIDFNSTRTLCVDEKSEIDIQVNYVLKDKLVQVLFLSGNGNIDDNNPIPWSEFDKNSVVAEISRTNNQLQLDWKGFTIDKKLATDYAILGKKNLEGIYKRK